MEKSKIAQLPALQANAGAGPLKYAAANMGIATFNRELSHR